MITEEQREIRNSGIGGSDAAAACGLSKYQTRAELFLRKKGQIPYEDDIGDAAHFGNILEEIVAQEFTRRTGIAVQRKNPTIRHKQHAFMLCHVDRKVVGKDEGLECKTINAYSGSSLTEPLDEHVIQVQHMMACTGWKSFYVAYLIGGQKFQVFVVERDEEMIAALIDAEEEFWGYVLLDQMPPMDPDHESTDDLLKRLYPGTSGATIEFSDDLLAWHQVLREAKDLEANYRLAADSAKRHLLIAMKEAAIGKFPDGSMYVRKLVSKKSFQVEATSYIDFRYKTPKE